MRLSALELQGFKSFADRTRLEFGDGITAVVGPNGSGKSNISDAMRWVLGEQSTKTLRGAKMEDVIFGGTQTRKGVGYSMVQLTIDNSDNTLPEQGEEITICRKLYRSGDSEYLINGTMVRLKDVHELFMDTGLGRDGYAIIGQGRIAEIVSAKSAQRREIFEEAAGISKFRYRRGEAERKLDAAQENLLRLADIFSELEQRVEPLKIQSRKAKEYLELAHERKKLEISLWLRELDSLKEKLSTQTDQESVAKNDYQRLELESQRMEEQLQGIYEKVQQLQVAAEERRTQIRLLEEKLSHGEAQKAVMENDIQHNIRTIERFQQELQEESSDENQASQRIGEKQKEFEENHKSFLNLQEKVLRQEEQLQEQKRKAQDTQDELRRIEVRRTSLERGIQEIKIRQATETSQKTESINRLTLLENSSDSYQQAVQEQNNNLDECNQQIREQQQLLQSLENSYKGYLLKRESKYKKFQALEHTEKQLRDQIHQRNLRIQLLKDLESNMEGFTGGVKYILNQASKGALSGVCGAFSNLISTDAKYTLAIEIALGGAMQNIVVEEEETAKKAMRMLKDAKAGRVTFLPITSVKGHELNFSFLEQQDGFIGNAARLVHADTCYTGIVNQLLGRVCIVEDLDAGTRIAKANGYKFRIVTLDGQVINAGGSYTGGSTARSAGVLGRHAEIDQLQKQTQELQSRLDGMGPEQTKLGEELSSLEASLSGIEGEQRTAQEEIVRLGYAQKQLQQELERVEENRALAAQELQQLTQRISQLENGSQQAEQAMDDSQQQLQELTAQSEEINSRFENLQIGIDTNSQLLSQLRLSELECKNLLNNLQEEIDRLKERLQSADTRRERVNSEIHTLQKENQSIEVKIQNIQKESVALKETIDSHNQWIVKLSDERTQLEKNTTEMRSREKQISSEREGISRELVRLQEHLNGIQLQYDSIISKLWDEYELTRTQAAEQAISLENPIVAQNRLNELKNRIRSLGSVNLEAVEEYEEVRTRYEFLKEQIKDVENSRDMLRGMINELTEEMRTQFLDHFHQISKEFSRIFTELFGGGRGELKLNNENEDVLETGIDIHVQPPGKVIKSLSLLSGGEQSFVAIAIYFAILYVKPAPFVLLDEIEAALDDVNVSRFAAYLRRLTNHTQFIAITHRRGTMEEADVLYGVTMQEEGVSKLLELKMNEVESKLGMTTTAS